MSLEKPVFLVKDGDVKIYRGDGAAGSLGAFLPTEEHIVRLIKRAYELGRADKAAQVREVLGVHNV